MIDDFRVPAWLTLACAMRSLRAKGISETLTGVGVGVGVYVEER